MLVASALAEGAVVRGGLPTPPHLRRDGITSLVDDGEEDEQQRDDERLFAVPGRERAVELYTVVPSDRRQSVDGRGGEADGTQSCTGVRDRDARAGHAGPKRAAEVHAERERLDGPEFVLGDRDGGHGACVERLARRRRGREAEVGQHAGPLGVDTVTESVGGGAARGGRGEPSQAGTQAGQERPSGRHVPAFDRSPEKGVWARFLALDPA